MGFLGSLGSFAGTAIGGYFGGTTGATIGGKLGGSLGDFIGNTGSAAISSALDYKTALKLMEKQFGLQKDLNKYNSLNRYPWAVKSLRDANLNPILAATQGQPLAGGSPQYNDVSPATRALHSAKALQEMEAVQAGIDKTKADTEAARQLAGQYSASAAQMKAQTAQITMLLDYYRKHPEVFAGQQFDRMSSKSGWIGLISDYLSSKASSSLNRHISSFDYGVDK